MKIVVTVFNSRVDNGHVLRFEHAASYGYKSETATTAHWQRFDHTLKLQRPVPKILIFNESLQETSIKYITN
jgi:hypothetical protein